jgi:deoxyribodipyrimidine photolyase
MSCYLNFGVVSIFRLAYDVHLAQVSKVPGADKFEEEIIKWREMSYAHAFSRGDYSTTNCLPPFSRKIFEQIHLISAGDQLLLSQIESGETFDEKWNSMQTYLIRTGELHNNVRMTWGKTISTTWSTRISVPAEISRLDGLVLLLCYLNDRFALDGLSPPSYGGILWCFGWCDKPDTRGGITSKNAKSYKMGAEAFRRAEICLLATGPESCIQQKSIIDSFRRSRIEKRPCDQTKPASSEKKKKLIGPMDAYCTR